MFVVGHKIWYADGSVYSGPWASAPATGAQFIVCYHAELCPNGNPYRTLIMGHDRYFMYGGAYMFTDSTASWIATHYPGAVVLESSAMPLPAFRLLRDAAMADKAAP